MSRPVETPELPVTSGAWLVPRPAALPPALARDLERAAAFAAADGAPSTGRAYASDWRRFVAWCQGHGPDAIPAKPGALAAFLASEAGQGRVPSTLRWRVDHLAAPRSSRPPRTPSGHRTSIEPMATESRAPRGRGSDRPTPG